MTTGCLNTHSSNGDRTDWKFYVLFACLINATFTPFLLQICRGDFDLSLTPPSPTFLSSFSNIWSPDKDSKSEECFLFSFLIGKFFYQRLVLSCTQTCRKYIEFFVSRIVYIFLYLVWMFLLYKIQKVSTSVPTQCSTCAVQYSHVFNWILTYKLKWFVVLGPSLYNDWKDFLRGGCSSSLNGEVSGYTRTWLLMSPCILHPNKLVSTFLSVIWSIKAHSENCTIIFKHVHLYQLILFISLQEDDISCHYPGLNPKDCTIVFIVQHFEIKHSYIFVLVSVLLCSREIWSAIKRTCEHCGKHKQASFRRISCS